MTSLFKKSFNIMKATFVLMKQHFSVLQFSILYKGVHGYTNINNSQGVTIVLSDGLRLVELLQVEIKLN